jgi:putative acetyltransferase
MRIVAGDLNNSQVRALLQHHVATARAETAPGSAHALDLEDLNASDVNFWAAWGGEALVAVGALKRLSNDHGEVKSMHTAQASRRRGVGTAMLLHIVEAARAMGLSRLSLETGSWPLTRSPASVADGTHQIAITAATTIFFMLCLPAIHARGELRLLHFARARTATCSQSSAKLERRETA